jgi:hypothetical protein
MDSIYQLAQLLEKGSAFLELPSTQQATGLCPETDEQTSHIPTLLY